MIIGIKATKENEEEEDCENFPAIYQSFVFLYFNKNTLLHL